MITKARITPAKTAPLYLTRFVAAYLVLCHHFLPGSGRLFVNFQEAVNYFYFLSGFVMIVSNGKFLLLKKNIKGLNRKEFWIKRFAKIYPLYLLAFVLCIAFDYFIYPPAPYVNSTIWPEALGLQTWLNRGSVNYPGWSVSCECMFYLLFPLTVPWVAGKPLKWVGLAAMLLFGLNIWLTCWLSALHQQHPFLPNRFAGTLVSAVVNQHPIFKYPVFLLGNVAGLVYVQCFNQVKISSGFNLFICVASLILIFILTQILPQSSPVLQNGVLCPLYFLFVLSACNLSGKLLAFFSSKIFILLGEISYACYIFQVPVQLLFKYCFNGGKNFSGAGMFFAFTVALTLISYLLYKYVEIPARRLITRIFVG